jgi:hypothetical protein
MSVPNRDARWRAAGTAVLLLLIGAVLGITVDRLWLSPPTSQAASLTVETMASRLGLSSMEERRLGALLDSLHAEILAAIAHGPDSLRAATDAAHRRIDASLPVEARPGFHAWMQEHHEQLMHGLHRGPSIPGAAPGSVGNP